MPERDFASLADGVPEADAENLGEPGDWPCRFPGEFRGDADPTAFAVALAFAFAAAACLSRGLRGLRAPRPAGFIPPPAPPATTGLLPPLFSSWARSGDWKRPVPCALALALAPGPPRSSRERFAAGEPEADGEIALIAGLRKLTFRWF